MKRLAILAAILIVVCYGVFEARRLIEGPEVTILSPQDGSATSSALVTISGRVQNVAFFTVNGKQAAADEAGRFVYRYSPPLGYTVAQVQATDRFGRTVEKKVSFNVLAYCPI